MSSTAWFRVVASAIVLFPLAAAAQTYTVEVRPDLEGLDVKIETAEMPAMLVLKLTNNTAGKVRCDLRYDASPQTLYRTSTYVAPGKTEQSAFQAKRRWSTVAVDVKCRPSDK
jgi:hypothetical protein